MWYAKSDVCYAYLYDVPDIDRLDMTSPFYTSRWFTRGWTLQELIAPTAMVFVSRAWDVLGTKTELVHHLQAITGIDTDILLRRRDLVEVSIAQKMSWAASRVTTKVEDEAYCLMGIFGVNMPTIYGEGRAAFYRLQEEIMKLSSDQTIFAWGDPYELSDILSRVQDHLERGAELSDASVRTQREFLLASRPEKFSSTAVLYVPTPVQTAIDTAKEACINSSSQLTFQDISSLPVIGQKTQACEFVVTGHGMRSTLPVIEVSYTERFKFLIAVLGCRNEETNALLGLLLLRVPNAGVGDHIIYGASMLFDQAIEARLVQLRPSDNIDSGSLSSAAREPSNGGRSYARVPSATMSWETIYILHRPQPDVLQNFGIPSLEKQRNVIVIFSRWSVAELERWGFVPDSEPREIDLWRVARGRYTGSLTFSDASSGEKFVITVERCPCPAAKGQSWARASVTISIPAGSSEEANRTCHAAQNPSSSHVIPDAPGDCSVDHIALWKDWTRTFGDSEREVRLSFSVQDRSEWDPNGAVAARRSLYFIVDIKLGGAVYARMRSQNISTKQAEVAPGLPESHLVPTTLQAHNVDGESVPMAVTGTTKSATAPEAAQVAASSEDTAQLPSNKPGSCLARSLEKCVKFMRCGGRKNVTSLE
ncbi:hypothetical protein ONZ51_g12047 [Trametes cubensis]|uniref:DUF8212 domain-containing protein n=1 Tax=Trametes cubensis TaxID=1111947 RepID=A0AAD7X4Y1_9APHY|nr:hypothetical protein ONZ51_g12047 [Trametes cubensis]